MSLLTRLDTTVQRDARRSGVPVQVARALAIAPVVLSVVVLATVLHRPSFEWITAEDSLLEWLQFIGFVIGAGLAALAVVRLRRQWKLAAAFAAIFAFACVFSAGEEISWGQRLFGWGTPPALSEINHQDETTVHNITAVPIQLAFNYIQLLIALYGGVLAVVLRARWRSRPPIVDFLLPPVFLAPAFLVMAVYRALRFTVITEDRFAYVKVGELPELCLAIAFAGFALTMTMRARRDDPQEPAPAEAPPARAGAGS